MEREPARNRGQLIWGAILVVIGMVALMHTLGYLEFLPTGSIFLGGIGLAFVAVHVTMRDYWWPIIPAGVLLTLALVASGIRVPPFNSGSLFFFGLGLTFVAVYLAARRRAHMGWALITTAALWGVGLMAMGVAVLRAALPLGLILAGILLLLRNRNAGNR